MANTFHTINLQAFDSIFLVLSVLLKWLIEINALLQSISIAAKRTKNTQERFRQYIPSSYTDVSHIIVELKNLFPQFIFN
jgi:hypothetical protein